MNTAAGSAQPVYGFQFPIVDDPRGVAFELFLNNGNPSLFKYKMPPINKPLGAALSLGIPGLASVELAAGINFHANLSVGYDTMGLRAFLESNDPLALARGFYIDNTKSQLSDARGNPYDHYATGVGIQGFMEAGARVLLVGVSGGLYANVSVHIDPVNNDPSGDQKVRLDKLLETIATNPLCTFAVSGKVYASLDISVGLKTPLGSVAVYSYNLANAVLTDFDTTCVTPTTDLEAEPSHTIYLEMTPGDDHITVQNYNEPGPLGSVLGTFFA